MAVKLIKFLDRSIGSLLCGVLGIAGKNKKPPFNRVLVVQLWGIGETVLALPSIRALRNKCKNAKINVLATKRNSDVFYGNKDIGELIVLKLNPISILSFIIKNYRKYDLIIDMEEYLNISAIISFFAGKYRIGYSHGARAKIYDVRVNYNERQHVAYTFLDLLKPLGIKKGVKNLVKLDYCTEDRKKVESLLKSYNIEKKDFLIGFGVGAAESAKSRMWPKERFAELADWLIEGHNAKIILIGNNDEKKLVNEIMNLIKNKKNSFDFAGKINVREMFYLISLCRLFIGNDSGPMHVAAAQGVKTIGLFGCNLPVRFEPFGKGNYAIYKKSTQDACINVHLGQVDECRYGMENACVRKIQVEDVIEVVNKIVKKG